MFGIALGSALLLFLLKEPVVHHENLHQVNTRERMSMISNGDTPKVTLKEAVMKLWNLNRDRRFHWIIPQTLWTGASIAYFSGNLVEMIQYRIPIFDPPMDPEDFEHYQYKVSMLCMVSFGAGEVLGCFFIGFFIDKIGSKISSLINVVLIIFMGIITIMFVKWPYFSVYIGHVMCFFWGFQDSAINTHA